MGVLIWQQNEALRMLPATFLEEVHQFWFGDNPADPGERIALWFGGSPDIDRAVIERFAPFIDDAADAHWNVGELTRRQQVGLIVLLDQLPRNAYRGTPRAYAHDARARALSRTIIDLGEAGLRPIEKMFLVLPFGHSERLEDQQFAVDYFETNIEPFVSPLDGFWSGAKRQAHLYRDIIARFGRFPQRNTFLHRKSSDEEEAFLREVKLTP